VRANIEAAIEITQEIAEHGPWHKNVSCTREGAKLVLSVKDGYVREDYCRHRGQP